MGLAVVHSRALVGVTAPAVAVEVHVAGGLPGISITGLPEAAVRESKDRVRAALQNCGFDVPPRRVTVHLAPADLPKEGSRFDLPIAVGLLAATGQLESTAFDSLEFAGELSLGGELRGVRGLLTAAMAAARAGHRLVAPTAAGKELSPAPAGTVLLADGLVQVSGFLAGEGSLAQPPPSAGSAGGGEAPELAEVRGQALARRALEIAAAGGHHLLLVGPPGTGKSMLAERLPALLPALSEPDALEVAAIRSAAGLPALSGARPYRAPHHTASPAAMVGGGRMPAPGEVTLAHLGVLFLDELPEFERRALEALREPMQNGRITVSRTGARVDFPARFQLIAAMNPCPCGYLGDPDGRCRCSAEQVARYRRRVSGPLLDRFDLQVFMERPGALSALPPGEESATVRRRVVAARRRQRRRNGGCCNAVLTGSGLTEMAISGAARKVLERHAVAGAVSARAQAGIMKVARTVADLAEEETVEAAHMAEAMALRSLGRDLA